MARWLSGLLVDHPIKMMAKFKSHHLIYVLIPIPMMMAGGEIFAIAGPEVVASFALDLAIYFDAIAVTLALAARGIARSGFEAIRNRGRKLLRRSGAGRRKRSQMTRMDDRASANDDDDPVRLGLAA